MSRHNHGTLNEVRLIARLGSDPEMRYTPSGIAVATLRVCTQTSWTTSSGEERREVEWHKVTVWGRQAEACNQHLTKGARVEISGSMGVFAGPPSAPFNGSRCCSLRAAYE
jgi:single-strand DNA-binding protein